MDLAKYVPLWANTQSDDDSSSDDDKPVAKEVRGLAATLNKAIGGKDNKEKKTLPVVQWMAAFERYAIAAVATEQLTLAQTIAHKNLVLKIGCKAKGSSRSFAVSIIYDTLVRKDWAARAYHEDSTLVMSKVCGEFDTDILGQAEASFDEHRGKRQPKTKGNTWGEKGSSREALAVKRIEKILRRAP